MGIFRCKRSRPRDTASPNPTVERPVSVELGPTWMSAEDWSARLSAYRRQGRSEAQIHQEIRHLQRRGPLKPRTRAESTAKASAAGIVSRAEYMDAETEARALAAPSGLPDARLQSERDRLLVVTRLGWVNPRSRTAYRAGLHSFGVAGTAYHEAAVKAGKFTPGAAVRLVREPDNVHDSNAIAVYAEKGRRLAGYVPKGQARRLAPLLDAGADLVAITVRRLGRWHRRRRTTSAGVRTPPVRTPHTLTARAPDRRIHQRLAAASRQGPVRHSASARTRAASRSTARALRWGLTTRTSVGTSPDTNAARVLNHAHVSHDPSPAACRAATCEASSVRRSPEAVNWKAGQRGLSRPSTTRTCGSCWRSHRCFEVVSVSPRNSRRAAVPFVPEARSWARRSSKARPYLSRAVVTTYRHRNHRR